MSETRTLVVWGGTGQAKVIRPIVEGAGHRIGVVFDRSPDVAGPFPGVPCLHDWAELVRWIDAAGDRPLGLVAAIGGDGAERLEVADRLGALGVAPVEVTHPAAWVEPSAVIGPGRQVLAGAVVGVEARLGRQCIVNTNASVDHECVLGDGVHVMPGATLAGLVAVGDCAFIGANATVLPRVRIGRDARIGAGAVVVRDVADGATIVGNPGRPAS